MTRHYPSPREEIDFLNDVVMTQKANLAVEQHIQERLHQRIRLAEAVCVEAQRIVKRGQGDTGLWDALDAWMLGRVYSFNLEANPKPEVSE